jgi:hypothetical protein
MSSGDPTPRLFAAAASLTGTGILMCRAEPSWAGLLIGLASLALWALGTLAARPTRLAKPARPIRPVVLEAVVVARPPAPPAPLLLPAPQPAVRAGGPAGAPHLPEVPTHRQRVVQGYVRQRR